MPKALSNRKGWSTRAAHPHQGLEPPHFKQGDRIFLGCSPLLLRVGRMEAGDGLLAGPTRPKPPPHLSSSRTHRSLNCRSRCFRCGRCRLRFFRNFRSAKTPRWALPGGDTWGGHSERTADPASGTRASAAGTSGTKMAEEAGPDGGLLLFSL